MTAFQSAVLSFFTWPVVLSFFTSRASRRMPALLMRPLRPPMASCAQATKDDAVLLVGHVEPAAVDAGGQRGEPSSLTSPTATWAPASWSR